MVLNRDVDDGVGSSDCRRRVEGATVSCNLSQRGMGVIHWFQECSVDGYQINWE